MDNVIYIRGDDGKEVAMTVLFTFAANGHDYVVVHDEEADDYYPFRYDEEGHLEAVDDSEEFAMVAEVFDAFLGEDDEDS